ncbi:hypothetical protein CAEBREN_28247 [Caenorhabditis brenneri]|uniref:Carrier domain-containing protein n=1 Tax=Caenorhabditis brenneri TaxID=135651 RepID=G0P6J6_CAEBE|nr:hypothetical protein CAEBREN_28247 [Caenorhabditis brenneri]
METKNETIFCEILPELCRIYEQKRFSDSLNIYMSDLRFGDDEKEVSSEEIVIRINQLRCITKFENCQAVKQKRMNGNDEMMFGIFGEESPSTISDISPEVAALNARLILPNASDEYVSHIEIRNYEIPLNPLFREIFSCSDEDIKLSQKEKNEIYLHVNLKKEQQTPRSAIFEAIFLLLEELNVKREIKRIKTLCFPFVHFGKVRISAKVDEKNGSLKIEIFNLFGSLFGFMVVLDEDSIDCKEVLEDVFMTETILKTKFFSDHPDSEDDSENLKEPDENQNSIIPKKESSMLSLLISILQEKMNLLKDLQDDVSTTPLPYLGIDSLRLAELEYHIMNSPDFKNCRFKAPFLIPYKTLSQIAEFLNKSKSEINGSSELKFPSMPKKPEGSKFEIPLSSQQKRILFVKELEKDQMKLLDTRMNSQFDEPVLLEFSEMDQDTVTNILNYLILVHSIFRTEYKEDFQYLLSATECFVSIREKEKTTERISISSGIRCIQKSDLKLQIIFNHISIDGRSLSVFYRQFKELLTFPNSSFPKFSLQYHDYCRSEYRTSDESLSYWKQYLNVENLELGKLPTDFSSDSEFFTASYIHKSFPVRLQRKFDAICNRISVSRFELFFGFLEISIHRTLGISETFAMGYAVDQRTFPYFETIGCFTNVLLYLSRKFDSKGLLNQLKECQKSLRESRSHGDISYENIAKLTGIKEDLFQCFVVSDVVDVEVKQSNKRRVRFEDEAVNVEIVQDSEIENKVSKYPMTWYLRQFENDQTIQERNCESILEDMFRMINSFVHLGRGGELDIISETIPHRSSVVSMQKSDFPTYTVSQIMNNNSFGSTVRYLQKDFKLRSSSFSSFLLKSYIQLHCQLLTEHPVILHMPRNPDLIQAVIGCWHAGFYPVPLHKDTQDEQIKKTCQGLGLKLEGTMILRSLEEFKTKKLNSDNWRVFIDHPFLICIHPTQIDKMQPMKSFFENTDKRPHRPKFTYMNYCCLERNEHHVKMDSEYLKTLIDGLEGWKFLETKTKVTEKVFIDLSRELISKKLIGSGDTPFSIFLKLISSSLKICFSKLTDFNIAFPVLNRNERTANICGYFLNNLIINSSQLESLPSIISANYPYSNVIQEVRRISGMDESVAEVYINCRYDLEFDESDDDILLDLVPLKLHFPIEFDVDLLANETYRVTMRSNKFTKDEMTKILMKLRNQLGETRKLKSDSVKNTGILYGVRKDIPKSSIPELYRSFFNSNFAYYLASRASPIRSDDIIGIIGRKSVETTVKCLAVQFTGVAYLPVDEEYPEERKKEILRDVQFVFQDFKEGEGLLWFHFTINNAAFTESTALSHSHRHFSISTPYCLSYIITTSGTTGRPKSVAIGADSLSNLCLSSTLTMKASNSSRIFQFTNFVFDNSVLEVSMAIASQATLIYGSSSFDPSDFEKSLETPGITHCLLFPSLVQSFDISKIKNLSYWIVGGERLPQNLLDSALKLGVCVIQNYGPTETTAFAIAKQMKEGDAGCHIGYPAFNTKVKIDDSGELLISGSGIMRGYLNREDCFKDVDSSSWYPSGDVCNVFNKSEVEFLARTDSQVKVRGFRVELSEIETIVESHDNVVNCKSIFESESQQIHLFYTGKASALELRQFCEKLLEPQKIPSTFNGIHEFPLTRNSKIDRGKLMEFLKNLTKPSTIAETFGIESELSSIWISLLNCPKPFHSDHFFLIGGHSLLLIRLRHLIQTRLDIQLSVPEILENLKFGEMLKLLQKKKRAINERIMIFFPALYGGCTAYLKLISTLKNRNEALKIVLLEEESGETVEEVAGKYKKQIEEKLTDQKRPLVFIGASSAGTFAYATAHQFNQCFRISVILLDSGTFWNLIEQLSFSKHEQEMIRNLKNYEVDQKTAEDLAASSWKTLQILKNYQPELLHRNAQMHILSVDGTDLGWSKYSGKLEVHKISGDHYSMLQENDNVLEIEQILTKILEEF